MSVLDVNMPISVYCPRPSELLVYTIIRSADNRGRNNETVLWIRVSRWLHFEKNEHEHEHGGIGGIVMMGVLSEGHC